MSLGHLASFLFFLDGRLRELALSKERKSFVETSRRKSQ
jgi:hypothetical protein